LESGGFSHFTESVSGEVGEVWTVVDVIGVDVAMMASS
jgi:hypothetical protein